MTYRQLIVSNPSPLTAACAAAYIHNSVYSTYVYSEAYILQETYLNITVNAEMDGGDSMCHATLRFQ
jgi:hypothetical protein